MPALHSTTPLAILGGTFDPVHHAHLAVARAALDVLAVEQVLWIPTGHPGYRDAPIASAEDRCTMLEAAFDGDARFRIDRRELAPEASGYTVDTLATVRAEQGSDRPLVLLLGTDQFVVLDRWSRWRSLFDLAHVSVYPRPGSLLAANPVTQVEYLTRRVSVESDWRNRPSGCVIPLELPSLPHSATDVRGRIARGEDASAMLPAAVLDYIRAHNLYR